MQGQSQPDRRSLYNTSVVCWLPTSRRARCMTGCNTAIHGLLQLHATTPWAISPAHQQSTAARQFVGCRAGYYWDISHRPANILMLWSISSSRLWYVLLADDCCLQQDHMVPSLWSQRCVHGRYVCDCQRSVTLGVE